MAQRPIALVAANGVRVLVAPHVAAGMEMVRGAIEEADDESEVPVPLVSSGMLDAVACFLEARAAGFASASALAQTIQEHPSCDVFHLASAATYVDSPPLVDALMHRFAVAIAAALDPAFQVELAGQIAELRHRHGVPDDLNAAEQAAAGSESPLTPEGPQPAVGERPCALGSLPGGDEMLHNLFGRLPPRVLSRAKSLSAGWRRASRRVCCGEEWQARHLQLGTLLQLGAALPTVRARLLAHPEEVALKERASGRTPLQYALLRAAGPQASRLFHETQYVRDGALAAAGTAAAAGPAAVAAPQVSPRVGADGALQGASEDAVTAAEWLALIRALIRAHEKPEDAVGARDVDGCTGLHLAAFVSSATPILEALLDAYPIGPWQKVWRIMSSHVLPRGGGVGLVEAPSADARRELRHIGQLPLHCACAGVGADATVGRLLDAYPSAASVLDAAGRTPLHYAAMSSASLPVVLRVLRAHPAAASVADTDGRLPLSLVLAHRATDSGLVRALIEAHPAGTSEVLGSLVSARNLSSAHVAQTLASVRDPTAHAPQAQGASAVHPAATAPPAPPGQQMALAGLLQQLLLGGISRGA